MTTSNNGSDLGIILASASPRRLELLNLVGVEPRLMPVDIDETPELDETAYELVTRLAPAKAEVARQLLQTELLNSATEPSMIIAADTVVEVDNVPYGKPEDAAAARATLQILSGREHRVLTGMAVNFVSGTGETSGNGDLAVSNKIEVVSVVEETFVKFRPLSAADIDWYVESGEPFGRAGAYAIQGLGALFVERIAGSYHNVMGLPLEALDRLIAPFGVSLRELSNLNGANLSDVGDASRA